MSFATLLLLAHIVARALALVGGRAFARVARKGTLEREHLKCLLRRLHAKGRIGAKGEPFLDTMQRLVIAVSAVARFEGPCPVARDVPRVWGLALATRLAAQCAPPTFPHDSS